MSRIVLHVPPGRSNLALEGWHLRLYRVIRDIAAARGIGLDIRARDPDIGPGTRGLADNRFNDGNLHIVDDRSVRAPNVLNAAVAYFWEFWHLDPEGTKAFSGIGSQTYDPSEMPYARAKIFFESQRTKLVTARQSKYAQTPTRTLLPKGCLAVFLQGDFPRRQGVTAFDDLAMVKAVLDGAGSRTVVVKPHPLVTDPASISALRDLERRGDLVLTDANVHDILTACAASVSINSTVALEGFLHRKPAVLFGQADFHQFAGRVWHQHDFATVLAGELVRQSGYAQFLAWYFLRHCLRIGSPELEADIWSRFAAAGFPVDRFG